MEVGRVELARDLELAVRLRVAEGALHGLLHGAGHAAGHLQLAGSTGGGNLHEIDPLVSRDLAEDVPVLLEIEGRDLDGVSLSMLSRTNLLR